MKTSMACSTMESCEYVRQMDRAGKITDFTRHRIQKAAITLLCVTIRQRDFALPIVRRASSVLGSVDIMWRRFRRLLGTKWLEP